MPPLLESSIGQYKFLTMVGAPNISEEVVITFSRAGVDGIGAKRLGNKGGKFELRTIVDEATLETARALMVSYKELIGQAEVDVKKDGVDYGKYWVLGVSFAEDSPSYGTCLVNGIDGTREGLPHAIVKAVWQLQSPYSVDGAPAPPPP